MRHLKSGRKLNRTKEHRKALMRNLATALFEHKRINTTEAKAKELRPYAEKIITRARQAYKNEQAGNIPEGHTVDVHARREVAKKLQNRGKCKAILEELFDVIAPKVAEREGGYTRVIKTDFRRGDGSSKAMIELVDWAEDQTGAVTINQAKKKAREERIKRDNARQNVASREVAPVVKEVVEEVPATVEEAPAPTTEEGEAKSE